MSIKIEYDADRLARVRGALPDNPDVIGVCDDLERLVKKLTTPFDRRGYMRSYMEIRRKKERLAQ